MTQQASQLSEDDARTASAQAQVRIAELEAIVVKERARADRAEARVAMLHAALQTIHDSYGKVCRGFELCTHAACQSSYGAWAVADAALAARAGEGEA
jgi:hypothetical protein